MTDPTSCGCPGYALTRRQALRSAAGVVGAGVVTSLVGDVLTATAYGDDPDGHVLVVLSQRGGADGLSMVVPHAEPAYYRARPSIGVAAERLLHADATFGLHPAFAPLSALWTSGRMAAVHAVGLPQPNRSHFDAMESIEDADPGSSERIGWLNRMIGALAAPGSTGSPLFRGVQVGSNLLPTSLVGPRPSLALASPSLLTMPRAGTPQGRRLAAAIDTMYAGADDEAGAAGRRAVGVAAQADGFVSLAAAAPAHGATYPATALGTALRNTAALVRSGVGARAVAVDFGGWDHHSNLTNLMTAGIDQMARGLAAFFADLGPLGEQVTVVTLSEFGRRLGENGAGGLDHGYGNAVLVLGGGVRGGRYYARWPTLETRAQVDGDLAMTTDYREVLGEILASRFPSVDRATVFPGAQRRSLGFMA